MTAGLVVDVREALREVVRNCSDVEPHSRAFVWRLLNSGRDQSLLSAYEVTPPSEDQLTHGGYPAVATLGFIIGTNEFARRNLEGAFIGAVQRLRDRGAIGLSSLMTDEVATLGIADGLAKMGDSPHAAELSEWMAERVSAGPRVRSWSVRMRDLACDLMDNRRRLSASREIDGVDAGALDLALRYCWPEAFRNMAGPSSDEQRQLLKFILTEPPPGTDDVERAAIWLRALDVLVDFAVQASQRSVSETVRILETTQDSFKRWRWEERARVGDNAPTRWAINNEYDVQALLWAILCPIYREDLIDEQYVASWGNVQPRVDLAILSLRLIIEVKFVRSRSDFKKFEEQILADVGLYFVESTRFDRMIVYVYDDLEAPARELYGSLRNALKRHERIEDVVIVSRPALMPDRGSRNKAAG